MQTLTCTITETISHLAKKIKCLVYSAKDLGFKWQPITFHVLGQ